MVIFIGGGIVPGYSGPIMNPARCFGPAVAMNAFEGQLIYWFGPLSASVLIAVVYWAVPPQHVAISQQKKDDRAKRRHHGRTEGEGVQNIDLDLMDNNETALV